MLRFATKLEAGGGRLEAGGGRREAGGGRREAGGGRREAGGGDSLQPDTMEGRGASIGGFM
jgi:hypothetical protein